MALREEFEGAGNWLFRRRSFLPLLLFPMLLGSMHGFRPPLVSHRLDLLWECLCFLIALMGLGLRAAAVGFAAGGTSGRSTDAPEAASLNTTGIYSVMRHPLYVGNYLMWLGVATIPRTWWLPALVSVVYWLYYGCIMFAEEEFLRRKFGEVYTRWAASTPALIPRPSLWRSPARAFSIRAVLRSEHSGFLSLVASFALLELVGDFAFVGRIVIDPLWGTAFVVAALFSGAVTTVKHRTRLLRD